MGDFGFAKNEVLFIGDAQSDEIAAGQAGAGFIRFVKDFSDVYEFLKNSGWRKDTLYVFDESAVFGRKLRSLLNTSKPKRVIFCPLTIDREREDSIVQEFCRTVQGLKFERPEFYKGYLVYNNHIKSHEILLCLLIQEVKKLSLLHIVS